LLYLKISKIADKLNLNKGGKVMLEIVKVVAPLLAVVSFILVILCFTKLGKLKIFNFVAGEFAMATAIAYSILTALGAAAPWILWVCFIIGLAKFANAMIIEE
jgi:hypothetical protein